MSSINESEDDTITDEDGEGRCLAVVEMVKVVEEQQGKHFMSKYEQWVT